MIASHMTRRSLAEHSLAMSSGEYTSLELTRLYLAEIEKREPEVGAFLTLDAEGALRAAAESDRRRQNGCLRSRLDGIPFAVKDNFCTVGMPTTCASKMLEDFVPPYDATAVALLREAGCVLLGKLNMDEFAMGSSTEKSALGITRNPHDPDYVAGGSSGGSAAAVGAYEVPFALGSDTGGSVRQPAAFCGVMGLKPTYGVISRYGMIALASSLDCVGILAHTAQDCAEVLSVLTQKDARDATTLQHPSPDFSLPRLSDGEISHLRVATVRELLEGVAPAVRAATEQATDALRQLGAQIEEVSLPTPDRALAAYCVLSAAEAASNMARYDGVGFGKRSTTDTDLFGLYSESRAEGFGNEVKRRILFGTYMLSEENRARYYDRAVCVRAQIRTRMLDILKQYDVILTPTTPTAAFRYGNPPAPEKRRRADLCAVYASLAGAPALSLPFGRDENGMPLGVHLTAAPFAERELLRIAARLGEVRA